MKPLKKIFYLYERSMFYLTQAVNEGRKPLILWNETALIMIFLSTVLGIKLPIALIVGLYLFVTLIGVIIGKILVVTGVVAYNTRLGNQNSPELMEILERLKKLETK